MESLQISTFDSKIDTMELFANIHYNKKFINRIFDSMEVEWEYSAEIVQGVMSYCDHITLK